MTGTIQILDAFEAVVQDLGRPAADRFGLPRGGASDVFSLRAANLLVGNPEDTPGIELTNTALSWVADVDLIIAVTGADVLVTFNEEVVTDTWTPLLVPAGTTVGVSEPRRGYRTYLSIRGGVNAPRRFGSAAPLVERDFVTPVIPGARLSVSDSPGHVRDLWWQSPPKALIHTIVSSLLNTSTPIAVRPGPDGPMFEGMERLYQEQYVMTPRSNAVGVRFQGASPRRTDKREILSRTIPIGSIEIPSEGEVIVLLRGRFMTAGYPVPAVVVRADLERMGQLRPGDVVRFREVSGGEARMTHFRQESWLQELAQHSPSPSKRRQLLPLDVREC